MKKFFLTALVILLGIEGFTQRIPVRDPTQDPCYENTVLLWGKNPYENVVELGQGEIVTFRTNEVCDASSYIWTTMDGFQATTTGPSFTLSSNELLWLPPSGCSGFNDRISGGAYHTSMSVRSNISNTVTIPVAILGVSSCEEGDTPGGLEDGEGDVPGSFTGCCN